MATLLLIFKHGVYLKAWHSSSSFKMKNTDDATCGGPLPFSKDCFHWVSQMLRGGTATCVYFTDAVMVLQQGRVLFSQKAFLHMCTLTNTHTGAQIMTSWTHQAMHDDVILILLTLVIKTGFADSPTPFFHQMSPSHTLTHTSTTFELLGAQSIGA